MEELIGILYEAEQKAFSKELDSLVDFNKLGEGQSTWVKVSMKILESKDDDIFSFGIKMLDDKLVNKLPSKFKPLAREVALSIINKDFESFKINAPELINQLVDVPKLTEEAELIIIAALVKGIIDAFAAKFKK